MATPMKPLVQGGSYYPSRVWTPFVKGNGFTTQDGGDEQGVPKTVSGALIHVLDALATPVTALTVDIAPVQSGSGDPAPDNVRPISGWTGVTISHSGEDTSDPEIITISWQSEAGTIYGGTLDVLTGVLTVTHRYFVADGTTIKVTGGYGAGGPNWLPAIVLVQADYADTSVPSTGMLTNYLVGSASFQSTQNTIGWGNSGKVIVLHIGTMQGTDGTHGYNSAAEVQAAVNAYLAENNLQVWYRLATPQTVQLTPAQLSTLAGENNVWADTGDVTMTYMAQGG